ncbi:MAG: CotH kinase family protein [Clostridiales Family XIII bacterium]|jgi:hypothetical protein|nr:CotH kinase family protein [Clostridiales Family XIII bacterium]
MGKRITITLLIGLLLIATACAGWAGIAVAGTEEGRAPAAASSSDGGIIIYQVYGRGDNTGAAVSHSFIELYNPTQEEVSLEGWSLQYTAEGSDWKVFLLSGSIPPSHSFLVRCFSQDGVATRYEVADFDLEWDRRISNNGYKLALVSQPKELPEAFPIEGDGTVDFLGTGDTDYAEQGVVAGISKQKSVRRVSFEDTDDNAADFEVIDYREKGLTDAGLVRVRPRSLADGAWAPDETPEEKRLTFSAPAGLYTEAFDLRLGTAYEEGEIRYTLDGSDPTPASALYTGGGIRIEDRTGEPNAGSATEKVAALGYPPPRENVFKGTVVRAQVFSASGEALSEPETRTYLVDANIFDRYGGLPVVSLSTDPANFFDEQTGIYMAVNADMRGEAWERPVHFEFFEGDGERAVSTDLGARIHGGYSRTIPQKSLRLYARERYAPGQDTLEYDLFAGAAVDESGAAIDHFENFILRDTGNDWGGGMINDALLQRAAKDLNLTTQAARQCVCFLNGEFWGIYNIRQRYDEHYFGDRYGLNESLIAMCTYSYGTEVDAGGVFASSSFEKMHRYFTEHPASLFAGDAIDPDTGKSYFETASELVDTDNLIDMLVVQVCAGNRDWPANNYRMWRYLGAPDPANPYTDGRWRFMLADMDTIMDSTFLSDDTLRYMLTGASGVDAIDQNPDATKLIACFFANASFRERFAQRLEECLSGPFSFEALQPQIDEMAAAIRPVIAEQIVRYPDAIGSEWNWENHIADMMHFAEARAAIVREDVAAILEEYEQTGEVAAAVSAEDLAAVSAAGPEAASGAGPEEPEGPGEPEGTEG